MNTCQLEEDLFKYWIGNNKKNITRPEKYSTTINTINNDLRSIGVDIAHLYLINDPNIAIHLRSVYLSDPSFQAKNKTGNRMYSRSFDLLVEYLTQEANKTESDISNIIHDNTKSETEKERLILTRLGQGKFREGTIKIWKNCSMSNYPDVSLLVASHIKPWCKSNEFEKTDPYNGLLLLPNYDKVFDKGLISFDENGKILISSFLKDPHLIGLKKDIKLVLNDKHLDYLTYHREQIFKTIY